MLVDPAINLYTTGPDSKLVYVYEAADPVEETQITGSKAKTKRLQLEDKRHHRQEFHSNHTHGKECRSKPHWGTVVKKFRAGSRRTR